MDTERLKGKNVVITGAASGPVTEMLTDTPAGVMAEDGVLHIELAELSGKSYLLPAR